MNIQLASTSTIDENAAKASVVSVLAGHFIGGGFDSEECEPISDRQFKALMALVVFATFAFGCIVNRWFL